MKSLKSGNNRYSFSVNAQELCYNGMRKIFIF